MAAAEAMIRAKKISKKKKMIAHGVFDAELDNFLQKELAEEGYSQATVKRNPAQTEITIMATKTQSVVGERGKRIRELQSVLSKRFNLQNQTVNIYAEKLAFRGLCAAAQAESIRFKLVNGMPVRKACYGVLKFIMDQGAKGVELVVAGKLRGARARSQKFVDGILIHSGEPVNDFIDTAVRHVLLKQGVLGVSVKIMLPYDKASINSSQEKTGGKPLPDHVVVVEPKDEPVIEVPSTVAPDAVAPPVMQ